MKRLVTAVLVFLVCAVGGWPQTRGRRRPAVAQEPAIIDIHQIDFRNYLLPLNGKTYKLIDGFYAETIAPDAQWGLEMIDGPNFSDLTGDRKDEVAFVLRYGPVTALNTAEARVYTLEHGQPGLLATFPLVNAVDCQLDHYMQLEDGTISVERIYGAGARCDHNEITQYRWNGNTFMPVGAARRTPCRCT